MTHEDRGHYASKHKNVTLNENTATALKQAAHNDTITCAAIHRVAGDQNITPAEAGVQADLLELRLVECQLGLFGYPPEGKRVDPDATVSEELDAVLTQMASKGRLSCKQCWDIAASLKIKRLDVGNACETKQIKIKPCQLGAF